jgi:hypothetical protein
MSFARVDGDKSSKGFFSVATEDDGGSFKTREDYMNYLATGSLLMSGQVKR